MATQTITATEHASEGNCSKRDYEKLSLQSNRPKISKKDEKQTESAQTKKKKKWLLGVGIAVGVGMLISLASGKLNVCSEWDSIRVAKGVYIPVVKPCLGG